MLEYLKKYEDIIYNCNDKEEMKKIVKNMYMDNNISDFDFNDLIYENVIPRLKCLDLREYSYENVIKENY